MGKFVPDAGDIVWLDFTPQAGREMGHRPALVLSPASYNQKTDLMVCCPMTTQIKGNPFEVLVEVDGIQSAILTDHLKSVDWVARRANLKAKVSPEAMAEVRAKVKALIL
ncbi:endoribonuclease MazF [Aquiluna sp. KACHI24]|uniref:endoribonuclease MazF n=1 Tax=Aquiluna sp. KACHI24 TaxID=2968831 RepID=UPI0021FE8720|nr:endoribonuclease MazF [Aquiluna sp. KACHI24]BDQ00974.1 mRNA-degrading endonuclease [Aquiluna sp. KACHI24]